MVPQQLPLRLFAFDAVEKAISEGVPFTSDADARKAASAVVELVAVYIGDAVLSRERELPLTRKLVQHLSSTGLQTKREIFAFAMSEADRLAERIREDPRLISDASSVADILR